jgi:hypothetical protein
VAETNVASRARWTINSRIAGNKPLTMLKSAKETDEADLEHVFNTAGEVIGELEKFGAGAFDIEYFQEVGAPEVNWRKLKDAKEYFSLTQQIVGGERWQFNMARVANVAGESDNESGQMLSVKLIFRGRKQL